MGGGCALRHHGAHRTTALGGARRDWCGLPISRPTAAVISDIIGKPRGGDGGGLGWDPPTRYLAKTIEAWDFAVKRTFTIIIMAVGLLGLLILRLHPGARAWATLTLLPFVQTMADLSWHEEHTGDLALSKVELVGQLDQMRAELAQQRLGDAERQQLLRENQDLRALLAWPPRAGFRILGAQVLAQDPASGGRRLRVACGTLNGVQVGQAVLSQGQLYGRICEVTAVSAVVQTLADPQCKVSVWLPDLGVHGILSGRGENEWLAEPYCEVRYLPRDRDYLVGMKVESSAYGEMVPLAIPIGELVGLPGQRVVEDFQHLYKIAIVRPSALRDHPSVLAILIPEALQGPLRLPPATP